MFSAPGMKTFLFDDSLQPSWNTTIELFYYTAIHFTPFLLQNNPKVFFILRMSAANMFLHCDPEILYDIQIRRLCGPFT